MAASWNELGVFRVKIPGVSCYLLRAGGGAVLVDTGVPGQAGRVEKALRDLGLRPADVRLILLTHHHLDHAGSAARLRELLRAPVAAHAADRPFVEAGGGPVPEGFTRVGRVMSAGIRAALAVYRQKPATVDLELGEGDSLGEFGVSGRVLHTPGHTRGSISVLTDSGAALIGDAAFNVRGPSIAPIGEDATAARRSFERVRGLPAARSYPGHGEPFF